MIIDSSSDLIAYNSEDGCESDDQSTRSFGGEYTSDVGSVIQYMTRILRKSQKVYDEKSNLVIMLGGLLEEKWYQTSVAARKAALIKAWELIYL